MQQYHDLVRHVLDNGLRKTGRNGDTLSVFGHQARYDLAKGFPLLTTKKLNIRAVINEWLWMVVAGSTDTSWLTERGHTFWDAWADESGRIGQAYGHQFRRIVRTTATPTIQLPATTSLVTEPSVFGVGELGEYDRTDTYATTLQSHWRDMLRRCYHKTAQSYAHYGAKGVHVHPLWHTFANFQRDAKRLPKWELKAAFPSAYTLDKDITGTNCYGPNTCRWASSEEQGANTSTNKPFTAVDPNGIPHLFYSVGQAHREFGLNLSAVHRCLRGQLHTHHDWAQFRYLTVEENFRLRFKIEDQVRRVLADLQISPDSRRHLISLWDTPSIDDMALPPCHGVVVQFYSAPTPAGRVLSCQMYQRSGDLGLGVPWNIAFYSLLTHAFAQLTGHIPGEFIHTLGDAHIYANHIDALEEQLTREPRPLPTLVLNPDIDDIDDFKYEDIRVEGYDPHPHIRMEVSA